MVDIEYRRPPTLASRGPLYHCQPRKELCD
nr:MAG TPA: hypothetical protein [Caudoviricetes sp.]